LKLKKLVFLKGQGMPKTEAIYPIIRTKLFRPEIVSDLVSRPVDIKKPSKHNSL